MNAIVVMSVTLMLLGGAFGSFESQTGLKLEDRLRDENRGQLITEDRHKDNLALNEADRNSDKFKLSKDKGDLLSVDQGIEFLDVVKFNDFEDFAERNDLDKSNKLIVQVHDENNHKESNAVQHNRGTSFDTKVAGKNNFALDSKIHESEDVAAARDSASQRSKARETASEQLLKDQTESLFGRGLNFEFLDLNRGFNDDFLGGNDLLGDHHGGLFGVRGLLGGAHRGGAVFDRFARRG